MPEVAEVECCRVCDSEAGCAFAETCPCHRKPSPVALAARDPLQGILLAPFLDPPNPYEFDADPDGGSF